VLRRVAHGSARLRTCASVQAQTATMHNQRQHDVGSFPHFARLLGGADQLILNLFRTKRKTIGITEGELLQHNLKVSAGLARDVR
jgi:hypothetical protein